VAEKGSYCQRTKKSSSGRQTKPKPESIVHEFFFGRNFFLGGGAGLQRVKVESGRTKAKEVGAKKNHLLFR
jgi:hypothetical protein